MCVSWISLAFVSLFWEMSVVLSLKHVQMVLVWCLDIHFVKACLELVCIGGKLCSVHLYFAGVWVMCVVLIWCLASVNLCCAVQQCEAFIKV